MTGEIKLLREINAELYAALDECLEMLVYVNRENGHIHNLDTLRTRINNARAAQAKCDLEFARSDWRVAFQKAQTQDQQIAELRKAAQAAWHLINSLLAVREGATDELLISCAEALQSALAKARG